MTLSISYNQQRKKIAARTDKFEEMTNIVNERNDLFRQFRYRNCRVAGGSINTATSPISLVSSVLSEVEAEPLGSSHDSQPDLPWRLWFF